MQLLANLLPIVVEIVIPGKFLLDPLISETFELQDLRFLSGAINYSSQGREKHSVTLKRHASLILTSLISPVSGLQCR